MDGPRCNHFAISCCGTKVQVAYAGKNGHDVAAAAAAAAASSSGRRLSQVDLGDGKNSFNNPSADSGTGSTTSSNGFNNGHNFGGNHSEHLSQQVLALCFAFVVSTGLASS